MVHNEALHLILTSLLRRDLGEAITATDNFLAIHPHQVNTDRLFAIRTDYQLMTDYWRRGFKDPQLPNLYDTLLKRMYVLYANIANAYNIRHTPLLTSLHYRAHMSARDWSPQNIREELESFVSDVAMLELEAPHTAEPKRKELYGRHQHSMVELFDYILTSGMWTDGFSSAMEEMLLSPTVDSSDQQLLVSGVMLATINCFDITKFRLLIHLYQRATDEEVRQRALIGWAFALNTEIAQSIYAEANTLVEKLLEDEACCQELVELQKQLIYCIDAERDHATIQNEIMPDLMKQPGFRITRNGIEENDESDLNEILHPDQTEANLERVEASFNKMLDMQKQGSDIYFGGFSQMKRFPFFNELANWFIPFDFNHPELAAISDRFKNSRFLHSVIRSAPFCNSDQYSFALAFDQVVNRIPPSYMEFMENSEATFYEFASEERNTPTFIRRMCLQDLYRFFRIFKERDAFTNIFDSEGHGYLILSKSTFRQTHVEACFNDVTAFLLKKNRRMEAAAILDNYGEHCRDFHYYMMSAYLGREPKANYAQALALQPDNERALAGYARALFNEGAFQEALDAYDKLLAKQPDKKSYQLNKAVCLTNLKRYDEAERVLFRLNYESEDDANVNRVLAWTLTCNGKYKQAEKLYNQLLSEGKPAADDLLNYGLCLWFSGHIDDAADCFHRYLLESGEAKESIIENELELIREKGITEPEIQMMLYIL
jgi:tetratricopeptide (TPR) repeat protein